MTKRYHMCVCISGLLKYPTRTLGKLFSNDEEKRSGKEVRDWLKLQQAQGKRVLPMGERCDGFSDIDGCPGHEIPDEPKTAQPSAPQP